MQIFILSCGISLYLQREAPIIMGTDKIKEYVAACFRSNPLPKAIIIIEPEREMPGMMAKACARPINSASVKLS